MLSFDSNTVLHIDYGSFFGGACMITISKRDDKTAFCSIRAANGWELGNDDEEKFTFPAEKCREIEEMISPLKEWEEKYQPEPENAVTDGFGWYIYANFGEKIERSGYVTYPDNYNSVMRSILNCIESIRAYDEGEVKNIPLLSP